MLALPAAYVQLYDAISSGIDCAIVRGFLVEIELSQQGAQRKNIENTENKNSGCSFSNMKSVTFGSGTEDVEGNMKNLRVSAEENNSLYHKPKNVLNERFDDYGETLLHLASRLAQTRTLRMLLEAGADPTIK